MKLSSVFGITRLRNRIRRKINNQFERDDFVIDRLNALPAGSLILDAGCGSQRYRKDCSHLRYMAQDFGQYSVDDRQMLGREDAGQKRPYEYGPLDYTGDICDIPEEPGIFDAILCTEVFEHIPNPQDALKEFSRLLKGDGTLILTAPGNCFRHMEPYFFYSGFSDHWYEVSLAKSGFKIETLETVGDFYSWMGASIACTTMWHSFLAKIVLYPAMFYYLSKKKTLESRNSLCSGYHVVARKIQNQTGE
jgi:SAM-dependent methyltransferase